jgi:hypothetical protein
MPLSAGAVSLRPYVPLSDTSACIPRPGSGLSHLRRVSRAPSHFGRARHSSSIRPHGMWLQAMLLYAQAFAVGLAQFLPFSLLRELESAVLCVTRLC